MGDLGLVGKGFLKESPVGGIKARLNITVKESTIQKQESTAVRYSSGPLPRLPTFCMVQC